MTVIDRVYTLFRRRRAAAKLGISFERSATFSLPERINLNGENKRLKLPDENGVKVAFVDLLLDDCYGCKVLRKQGESVETILDIGGNVGLFGIAARNVFPDAVIHSYEPNKQLEPYLAEQAEVAGFDYFMEAVGLDKGMISLDINEEESVHTRSCEDESGSVPQISFREAIERMGGKVDFLKMDCEGAEWGIFEDKESWKYIKYLAMEYHLFEVGHNEMRVKAVIEGLGFTVTSFSPVKNYGLLIAKK